MADMRTFCILYTFCNVQDVDIQEKLRVTQGRRGIKM